MNQKRSLKRELSINENVEIKTETSTPKRLKVEEEHLSNEENLRDDEEESCPVEEEASADEWEDDQAESGEWPPPIQYSEAESEDEDPTIDKEERTERSAEELHEEKDSREIKAEEPSGLVGEGKELKAAEPHEEENRETVDVEGTQKAKEVKQDEKPSFEAGMRKRRCRAGRAVKMREFFKNRTFFTTRDTQMKSLRDNMMLQSEKTPVPEVHVQPNSSTVPDKPMPREFFKSRTLLRTRETQMKSPRNDAMLQSGKTPVPEVHVQPSSSTVPDKPKLLQTIANTWSNILKNGLEQDSCAQMMERHPGLENCNLAPPKLNPEVEQLMDSTLLAREARMCFQQELAGASITAISRAILMLITTPREEWDYLQLIRWLGDAVKLTANIHHEESMSRRALVTPCFNENAVTVCEGTKITDFLFGDNFGQRVLDFNELENLIKPKPQELVNLVEPKPQELVNLVEPKPQELVSLIEPKLQISKQDIKARYQYQSAQFRESQQRSAEMRPRKRNRRKRIDRKSEKSPYLWKSSDRASESSGQ